jgi:hypothetical protein
MLMASIPTYDKDKEEEKRLKQKREEAEIKDVNELLKYNPS